MSTSCPCPESVLHAMKGDLDRCVYSLSGSDRIMAGTIARVFLLFPGLWALTVHRLTHHLTCRFRPRALGRLLYVPMSIVSHVIGIVLGVDIDPHAHIGGGFFINHFGGIHIGEVVIGENCNISHGVTIGNSSRAADAARSPLAQATDSPTLGDRVWVGPGAIIVGPVTIGHDSTVAANSLVTHNVTPLSVMLGVPAAAVSHRGSFAQVAYRGMAEDLRRAAALAAQRATQGDSSPWKNSRQNTDSY